MDTLKGYAVNILFFCVALPLGILFICACAVVRVVIGGIDGFFERRHNKGSTRGLVHGRR